MQKLIEMKPIKLDKIKEKEKVYNKASELYNKRFKNCYMDIINKHMLKKISTIKSSNLKT